MAKPKKRKPRQTATARLGLTPQEVKRFRDLAYRVNRKRSRILKGMTGPGKLPTYGPVGYAPPRANASITRFSTRQEFEDYAARLRRYSSRGYKRTVQEMYKDNFLRALEGTIGKDNELYRTVEGMSAADISDLVVNEYIDDLDFWYNDPNYTYEDKAELLLSQIRSGLKDIKEGRLVR